MEQKWQNWFETLKLLWSVDVTQYHLPNYWVLLLELSYGPMVPLQPYHMFPFDYSDIKMGLCYGICLHQTHQYITSICGAKKYFNVTSLMNDIILSDYHNPSADQEWGLVTHPTSNICTHSFYGHILVSDTPSWWFKWQMWDFAIIHPMWVWGNDA